MYFPNHSECDAIEATGLTLYHTKKSFIPYNGMEENNMVILKSG
jgi:hypothetical protein